MNRAELDKLRDEAANEHAKNYWGFTIEQSDIRFAYKVGWNARDLLNIPEVENLKMICRRLAAAKSIESRDKIAEQCRPFFEGTVLR